MSDVGDVVRPTPTPSLRTRLSLIDFLRLFPQITMMGESGCRQPGYPLAILPSPSSFKQFPAYMKKRSASCVEDGGCYLLAPLPEGIVKCSGVSPMY